MLFLIYWRNKPNHLPGFFKKIVLYRLNLHNSHFKKLFKNILNSKFYNLRSRNICVNQCVTDFSSSFCVFGILGQSYRLLTQRRFLCNERIRGGGGISSVFINHIYYLHKFIQCEKNHL